MKSGSTSWLVKVGGRILGPFTDRDVSEKLRSREFRVIDEVSEPCGRWIYIRDEPRFAKVVEEVRLGNVKGGEDTVTGSMEAGTRTPTNTITLTENPELDDLTEEITQSTVQEAMYQSFDDINRGGQDRRSGGDKPESYTFEGDQAVEASAKASTKWVGALTLALIMLALAYVTFNQFISQPIEDKNIAEESRSMAAGFLRVGNYQKALELFRRAHSADPDDRSIYAQLGVLEIQVGNQSVVGRRLLEKVRNWVGVEKKNIFTGMGLAALKEGEFEKAKDLFNQALEADPLFLPAVINLGVSALYLREYQGANNFFQLALKDGSRDGLDLLLLVETLYQLNKNENDLSYLREAKRYLDGMRKVSRAYLDEVLIASAYIESLLGNLNNSEAHIESFLERPLGMTDEYKHDIMVHRDQLDWIKLNQWCLNVTKKLDPTSHIIAAEAKCLYLSGDVIGANRKIEDAVMQTPKDPLVQAAYSELLKENKSFDKAKVSMDKAFDFNKDSDYTLPLILQAEYCEEQNDYFCSLNYWQEVLKRNSNSEIALAGVARSYYQDGHYSDAKRYLALALRLRTPYKPILKLERDLKRAQSEKEF